MINLRASGIHCFDSTASEIPNQKKEPASSISKSTIKKDSLSQPFKQVVKKNPKKVLTEQQKERALALLTKESENFTVSPESVHARDQYLINALTHPRQALTSTWQNVENIDKAQTAIILNQMEESFTGMKISKEN